MRVEVWVASPEPAVGVFHASRNPTVGVGPADSLIRLRQPGKFRQTRLAEREVRIYCLSLFGKVR